MNAKGTKEEILVTHTIREILRKQIISAVKESPRASHMVFHPFTLGYFHAFILHSYNSQGMEGKRLSKQYFKEICEAIYPGKLYRRMGEMEDLIGDKEGTIFCEGLLALYTQGAFEGLADTKSYFVAKNIPQGLFGFLTGTQDETEAEIARPKAVGY